MRCPKHGVVLMLLLTILVTYCKAQTWQALNPPLNPFNGPIYATTVDASGAVYAAGDFKNNNQSQFVARWDRESWTELGSGIALLSL